MVYDEILKNLLRSEAGERLRFKATTDVEEVGKTVVGLLNHHGGDVLVGVDEQRKVCGIEKSDFELLAEGLHKRVSPSAPINCLCCDYDGKRIGMINVWEGSEKPYMLDGRVYANDDGKEFGLATSDSMSRLVADRSARSEDWELQTVMGVDEDELDLHWLELAMEGYNRRNSTQLTNVFEFLRKVGLIKRDSLTNAAVTVFGKNPTRVLPQANVRFTVHNGVKKGDVFLFDKIYNSGLLKDVAEIYRLLAFVYGKREIVGSGLTREERWNFPNLALREGIINACVHRDMSAMRSFVQVNVYADRTEIDSYGSLLPELKLGDLLVEHRSVLRNPKIAEMCYYAGYMEMLGTGTQRMALDCRKGGFGIPEFTTDGMVMRVTFPGLGHNMKTDDTGVTDKSSLFEGIIEGIIEGINQEVKAKLVRLMLMVDGNPGINASRLSEALQIPQKSMERYLKMLKDASVISYRGAKKNGGYYII